jgi:hypothetical protein
VPLNFFPTASSQLSDIYGSSGKQVDHIVKHWCSLLVLQLCAAAALQWCCYRLLKVRCCRLYCGKL